MKRIVFLIAGVVMGASGAWAQAPAKTVSLYKSHCAMCHGDDGTSNTPAGKALGALAYGAPAVKKASDAQLEEAIAKGKGQMPPFGSQLSAAQIKSLVAYVRELGAKQK